jgi:hypothetical protein
VIMIVAIVVYGLKRIDSPLSLFYKFPSKWFHICKYVKAFE